MSICTVVLSRALIEVGNTFQEKEVNASVVQEVFCPARHATETITIVGASCVLEDDSWVRDGVKGSMCMDRWPCVWPSGIKAPGFKLRAVHVTLLSLEDSSLDN